MRALYGIRHKVVVGEILREVNAEWNISLRNFKNRQFSGDSRVEVKCICPVRCRDRQKTSVELSFGHDREKLSSRVRRRMDSRSKSPRIGRATDTHQALVQRSRRWSALCLWVANHTEVAAWFLVGWFHGQEWCTGVIQKLWGLP